MSSIAALTLFLTAQPSDSSFLAAMASRPAPIPIMPHAANMHHSPAAARQLLGYEPRVRFAEGLRQTIERYRWALETGYGGWARR